MRPHQIARGRRPTPSSKRRTRQSVYRRRQLVAAGVLAAVTAGIILAIVEGGPGASKPPHHHHTTPPAHADTCPLTGVRPPGGHVPDRPALAVKIGNEPSGARPQSGLNEADIVYDTPAEGFIMRYMAVYQCNEAASIGPTRSVRWVDWHILQQFGHPVLAFAGGINPNLSTVAGLSWLKGLDLLQLAPPAATRITSRVPPENLYTATSALWALDASNKTLPPAVFKFGPSLPAGAQAASSVAINFSTGTDVVWKWDPSAGVFLHTYSGQQDVDALTHQPVSATNVVIQIVSYKYGPYIESPGGTGDVESQTVGSGRGYVLRGGKEVRVTWHRAGLSSPTTFTDAAGHAVTLAPGRTWVELVLNTVAAQRGAIVITK